ncbi:MAG: GDP-L-fucose synthase [Candidatus Omnitrophota bacterium]
MKKEDKIFIAGKWKIVDEAIFSYLKLEGFRRVINVQALGIDLNSQSSVASFFRRQRPDYVFLTGGRHGGIEANRNYPGEFIYDNLQIQLNVIHSAKEFKVKKLVFLASSCVYPRDCPQPMREEYLLDGKLEEISQWYAMAKLSGLKMCQAYNRQFKTNFISAIPATIFGPGDEFNLKNSHVLPAILKKFHDAKIQGKKQIGIWGDGRARREFIFVDDLAGACVFLMRHYNGSNPVNIGYGSDLTIRELALIIKEVVGYRGKIVFDRGKPGGVKQKLLDSGLIKELGWQSQVNIEDGIRRTYEWYKNKV